MPSRFILAAALMLIALAGLASPQTPAAPFDYYVLSLSWAPSFCAQSGDAARNPEECAVGRGIGFIVHGLWPQSIGGKSPESCAPPGRLSASVIKYALPIMFSPGLIRHEWAAHGTCTALRPFDYFSKVAEARAAMQIPVQITSVDRQTTESPGQIETEFAGANPSFPKTAFRTSCAARNFEEERICFDKNLKPRACTAGAGECRTPAIVIRPPL